LGVRFTKCQAGGNDFVVLDALEDPRALAADDPRALARAVCDRHFGVGADGLLVLGPDDDADAGMAVFNADGSDGEACGNGMRCVVRLLVERGHATPDEHGRVHLRTGGRIAVTNAHLDDAGRVEAVTVDMGSPRFGPDGTLVDVSRVEPGGAAGVVRVDGVEARVVDVVNPHAVVESDSPERDLFTVGPRLEKHPAFPRGMNVHLVSVRGPEEVHALTWERGVGHTLSCGSGACAVVAALSSAGRLEPAAVVRSPGGEVFVRYDPGADRLTLTGGAEVVFLGEWPG
jgi:diaminopimelate epimerase